MKNLLITGTGRSGTSLVTGILNNSGFFSGDNLYLPRESSNPTGFFENHEINGINEAILEPYDGICKPRFRKINKEQQSPYNPNYGQRWLSLINSNTRIYSQSTDIERRIKFLATQQPFAFKDPRFSFTYEVWEQFLPKDTQILVMFREPYSTIQSILKEVSIADYLKDFKITLSEAENIWYFTYSRLLEKAKSSRHKFIFLNYKELMLNTEVTLNMISKAVEARLDPSILYIALYHQNTKKIKVSKKTEALYQQLLDASLHDH